MAAITVEICLAGVDSAVEAERGGATRVELCDSLIEGGTTPSYGTIALARQRISIDLIVMIRPRAGDFLYSDLEFHTMRKDVIAVKALGVTGVVFGMLLPDGSVDCDRTAELVTLARPLSCTFHRAFDMTNDPFRALRDLMQCGVDRILTSGQAPTALQGLDLIRQLQDRAGDSVSIMPAVKVNSQNARHIVDTAGVKEVHLGSDVYETRTSAMKFLNSSVAMGDDSSLPEYTVSCVSSRLVSGVVNALRI